MGARTARSPLFAAGLTAILAAALAGCAAASSGASGTSSSTSSTPSSPLDAVRLASKTTSGANSFTGTISVQARAKSGSAASQNVSMTATMAEQLHPSLLTEVQIGTLQAAGSALMSR